MNAEEEDIIEAKFYNEIRDFISGVIKREATDKKIPEVVMMPLVFVAHMKFAALMIHAFTTNVTDNEAEEIYAYTRDLMEDLIKDIRSRRVIQ